MSKIYMTAQTQKAPTGKNSNQGLFICSAEPNRNR